MSDGAARAVEASVARARMENCMLMAVLKLVCRRGSGTDGTDALKTLELVLMENNLRGTSPLLIEMQH